MTLNGQCHDKKGNGLTVCVSCRYGFNQWRKTHGKFVQFGGLNSTFFQILHTKVKESAVCSALGSTVGNSNTKLKQKTEESNTKNAFSGNSNSTTDYEQPTVEYTVNEMRTRV